MGQKQLQVRNNKETSARWTGENLKMSAVTLEWAEVTVLQVHRDNRVWRDNDSTLAGITGFCF